VISAFLPADFDSSRPLALVAGQGNYPAHNAKPARDAGVPVRLLALEGETPDELVATFPENERVTGKVGQVGKMLRGLRDFGAAYAIMAGQVTPRRLFNGLHPDITAARLLFSLKRRNAETIFGAIANEIEKAGAKLLDARSFMDAHLAHAGCMTGKSFPIEPDCLAHGVQIARECARLDIGQGCVVRKGTVLAVEAFEGTNEMIRRAGAFKTDRCLYVKTVKAGQDYRFDVPCFGLHTLEIMSESGVTSAALEAGRVIMLDKPAVLERARQLGINLLGFE
jgi:DUF1009 family protein